MRLDKYLFDYIRLGIDLTIFLPLNRTDATCRCHASKLILMALLVFRAAQIEF